MVTSVSLPRLGRTFADLSERTVLTNDQIEVGDEALLLAAGMYGDTLLLRTGNLHRLARLVQLDGEIRQVELLGIGAAPTNGRLNVGDVQFMHTRVGRPPAVASIRVDRLQFSAILQVGCRFGQQLAVVSVV